MLHDGAAAVVGVYVHTSMCVQQLFKGTSGQFEKSLVPQGIQGVKFDDDDPEPVHQVIGNIQKRFVFKTLDVHLQQQIGVWFQIR